MLEALFREIAQRPAATYQRQRQQVMGTPGAQLPITVHHLSLAHRGVQLTLQYELGNHNLAEVRFTYQGQRAIPAFELDTREPLARLFRFNKAVWIINCRDGRFERELRRLLEAHRLTRLAEDTLFNPLMKGKENAAEWELYTRYHLAFADKEKSVLPILDFHCGVIDYLYQEYGLATERGPVEE
ncbi:MAG: hypothetical protein AAFW73_18170 [Bacteroidota bacterium]